MVQVDFIILLVAGVLGSFDVSSTVLGTPIKWGWVVVTIWAILRLIGAFA